MRCVPRLTSLSPSLWCGLWPRIRVRSHCQGMVLSGHDTVKPWHPCHVMPGHDTICHILYLSWYYLSRHVKSWYCQVLTLSSPITMRHVLLLSWYYLPCHVKSLYCHVLYLSWYYLSCHVLPVLTLSTMLCHTVTLSILAMTQLMSNDSQLCHGVPTPTVMSHHVTSGHDP